MLQIELHIGISSSVQEFNAVAATTGRWPDHANGVIIAAKAGDQEMGNPAKRGTGFRPPPE
jgi:hypothetical protein